MRDPERAARLERDEPIAIVGLGCRFPAAPEPAAFWSLLRDGTSGIGDLPDGRWDRAAFEDPDPASPGKTVSTRGGFLGYHDQFDAAFFGVSPREAAHLDPRQRLVLEVAWEALEDAGIPALSLAGSQTGVFVATQTDEFGECAFAGDPWRIGPYSVTGSAHGVVANRVSYALDLHGPSFSVDSACSGSLMAVHLACASLRRGDSALALAGGASVILMPHGFVFFSKVGTLSPDGISRPFDRRANGLVRSEGVGLVVLKTLQAARRDGDRIYAIIRGSAVNHDGRTGGLMAPNRQAQVRLLAEAWARAGIAARDLQFVEMHGLGTPLADSIEVASLADAIGTPPDQEWRCAIGSVKSNVGHMEAAAGIGGLLKVVLAIWHRELPGTPTHSEPSPLIPFDRLPLFVPTSLVPWPRPADPLVAGLSGFGFGGANAHLVVEEAPSHAGTSRADGSVALLLSAKQPKALHAAALAMREGRAPQLSLADAAYTAACRRSHLEHRLAIVGRTWAAIDEALAAFAANQRHASVFAGNKPSGHEPKLAFLFGGHAAQPSGDVARLIQAEPLFADVFRRCDAWISRELGWSLFDVPAATGRRLDIAVAQPALVSVQIALATLWRSWGIVPDLVIGQGAGEISAACAADALTLEDALRIAAARSGADPLCRTVGDLRPSALSTAFVSSVTGASLDSSSLGAQYWLRDPREGSNLPAALSAAVQRGCEMFVEIGTDPVLADAARDALRALKPTAHVVVSMKHDEEPRQTLLEAAASLHVHGRTLDWTRIVPAGHVVGLPLYRWQRQRHWYDGAVRPRVSHRPEPGGHPLLTRHVQSAESPETHLFEWDLDANAEAARLIAHHRVGASAAVPGAIWIEMARAAAARQVPESPLVAQSVQFRQLLTLSEGADARRVQLALTGPPAGPSTFRIFSRPTADGAGAWTLHAEGIVRAEPDTPDDGGPTLEGIERVRAAAASPMRAAELYDRLARRGLEYGPSLRVVQGVWKARGEAVARLELPAESAADAARFGASPALLDGMLQAIAALQEGAGRFLPAEIGTVRCRRPFPARGWCHLRPAPSPTPHDGAVFDLDLVDDGGALIGEIRSLHLKRVAEPASRASAGTRLPFVYEPVWLPASESSATPSDDDASLTGRRWVVFSDEGGVGERIAADLRGRGAQCTVVRAGDRFAATDADAFVIDPEDGDHYRMVLDHAGGGSALGLLHLWSLDARGLPAAGGAADLVATQRRGAFSLLRLVQAASDANWTQTLRTAPGVSRLTLWVVTRGATAAAGRLTNPAQAGAWGVGRVIAQEHPELTPKLIDLDPIGDDDAACVRAALAFTETQVAFRGRPFVYRLQPAIAGRSPVTAVRGDRAYVIAGGLGDLGLAVARRLAERGARWILLLGRTALPPRETWMGLPAAHPQRARIDAVRGLEALGATVAVAEVDVASSAAVRDCLAARRADGWPALAGVVLAAGTTADRLLLRMDDDTMAAPMGARLASGWWKTTDGARDLDWLVMFSSLSAVFGSLGQANYAAGNAVMDALAFDMRAAGIPAISVGWGPWAQIGGAARRGVGDQFASIGLRALDPDAALDAFEAVIDRRPVHAVVADVDWDRCVAAFRQRSRWLAAFVQPLASGVEAAGPARPDSIEQLIGDVLLIDPAELDPDAAMSDLGVDSIMSAELRAQIQESFGVDVPLEDLVGPRTVGQLAELVRRGALAGSANR